MEMTELRGFQADLLFLLISRDMERELFKLALNPDCLSPAPSSLDLERDEDNDEEEDNEDEDED